MKTSALKRNLFLGSVLVGAAVCGSALAQDAQAPQEIVVTGSRIASPNLTSISPVTSVTSAEIKLEGVSRVEDLLNNLPAVFSAQGSNISNGSNGTATVDLRGLGSTRTLVLVDGRRLLPGDPGDPSPDLNNIPAQLVDRIEIDTGGASAVYGSDAVSGVVNFILKRNFVGVQIDAQGSAYQDDNSDSKIQSIVAAHNYAYPKNSITDGWAETVNLLLGVASPDGKGNLEAYATYRNVEAVLEADRDYTACTLSESNATFACGGSSTTSPPRLALISTNGNPAATGKAGASYTTVGTGAGATLAPYTSADAFNYGPYNYLQRPDVRYNLGTIGHYEISPMADVYTEFMFMDDESTAQIAPGGIFYGTNYTVPCSNQFLTASELNTFCGGSTTGSFVLRPGKRNVEGGGRQSEFRHTSYRLVTGLKGDLDKTWSYDGYLQYGTTIAQTQTLNYFSSARIANALAGCPTVTTPTCVPYNLFQGGGATVTPAQLAYIQVPGIAGGQTVEQIANLTVNGKLGNYGIRSPWAADGVNVALGTEYRRENITEYADAEEEAGDLSGSGGAILPIGGSFDVYELFAEALVPLAQDKPFAYSANLDLAYRWSDYSSAGDANTYAIQGDWSPVKDLRLRASFQRAVRAPNVLELFSPQNVTLANYVDPCGGTAPTYTLAQCERTGMTAAEYGSALNVGSSANQNNQLTGGNTALKPEIADTYSGGFVFQPHFVPGFSFSVDYFNIFVANVIQSGVASATTVLSECAVADVSYYCGLIHRDQGSFGSLGATNAGYIVATNVNAGSLQTSGIDFDLSYRTSLAAVGLTGWGSLTANFTGTYLESLITESLPTSGEKYDCAGYYGEQCGTPAPKWRSQLRLTWNTPWHGLQISGRWRYFGSVAVDLLNPSPLLNGSLAANGAIPDAHMDAQNYYDLAIQYRLFDKYQLRIGVNNLFDKRPPIVGADECPTGPCNGNVYSQAYDSLGRYMFVALTANY
jgi:outer membrane receptor protein involved in Fe transport